MPDLEKRKDGSLSCSICRRGAEGGFPVIRQFGLGIAKDRQDRPPSFQSEPLILWLRVFADQDIPKSLVNVRPDLVRQLIERLRVDEIAARILEQPRLQIEIAERTPLLVARPLRREVFCEIGGCF